MRAAYLTAPFAILGAFAANAGGYTPPVVEPVVVTPVVETAPVGDWTGGYAGLTLGYGFGGKDAVGINSTAGLGGTPGKLNLKGVNGGVHVGYRWQRDRWVFGPELGYEGGSVKDSFSNNGYDAESKIKNVLALRMKTGYEVSPGTLVYGIAGVARAKVDYSLQGTGAPGAIALDDSFSRTGYIVGLGAEKKLNDRMSVTGEYEYANFGEDRLEDGLGAWTNATAKFHNVKLGLNFKF